MTVVADALRSLRLLVFCSSAKTIIHITHITHVALVLFHFGNDSKSMKQFFRFFIDCNSSSRCCAIRFLFLEIRQAYVNGGLVLVLV